MTTDSPKLFSRSAIELTGADMSRRAAQRAYRAAGISAQDNRLRVVECHDCFAPNEVGLWNIKLGHACVDALVHAATLV